MSELYKTNQGNENLAIIIVDKWKAFVRLIYEVYQINYHTSKLNYPNKIVFKFVKIWITFIFTVGYIILYSLGSNTKLWFSGFQC